jgi:hypothetical protein
MRVKLSSLTYIRAIAIVLLFAMFHYVAGYRLLYSLGIIYTKIQANECMADKSDIKKITLSAFDYNSLKWTQKNKEFSLHNQMYDISGVQKIGNNYIIAVYADNPETKLLAALHQYENELFHPDQANKTSKSAEDIMSSFQKEYVSKTDFTIQLFALKKPLPSIVDVQQHHLQIPDNIWHPPLGC